MVVGGAGYAVWINLLIRPRMRIMIPDWLTLVLWARLPRAVARLSPALASILTDGVYLVRGTFVASGMPVLCLLFGMLAGTRHQGETYTASLLVMGFLGAAGMLSAHLGLWGTLGYAVGDLVIRDRVITQPQGLLALLLSYGLLALLTVYLPLLTGEARLSSRNVNPRGNPPMTLELLTAAVVAGSGVFVWSQALRVLILPVFAWQGVQARFEEIAPLRDRWQVLVGILAVTAALRVWREHSGRGEMVKVHVAEVRAALAQRTHGPLMPWPRLVAIGMGAALLTLTMAGLISSPAQALLVLAFFAALLQSRGALAEIHWPLSVARVPTFARVVLAVAVGYGVSWVLLGAGDGSWPALVGACLTAALILLAAVQPRPQGIS
jgi:hypothetical protein